MDAIMNLCCSIAIDDLKLSTTEHNQLDIRIDIKWEMLHYIVGIGLFYLVEKPSD